jgi:hypothetical protein
VAALATTFDDAIRALDQKLRERAVARSQPKDSQNVKLEPHQGLSPHECLHGICRNILIDPPDKKFFTSLKTDLICPV